MSDSFHVRPATAADVDIIAWHRVRMFQDMGEVPDDLFDEFRAKAKAAIAKMIADSNYIGWLASPQSEPAKIIGGAGLQIQRSLPHPFRSDGATKLSKERHGIIINVFTEPKWRRRGVAELLLRRIVDWARTEEIDRIVLHASNEGRSLYERLGFVASNEMRFGQA